jgi:hypothetical protein
VVAEAQHGDEGRRRPVAWRQAGGQPPQGQRRDVCWPKSFAQPRCFPESPRAKGQRSDRSDQAH